MDWSDHPNKTQEWYNKRKEKAEREGLTHIFAQEVDRDYSASKTGVIIKAAWVKAAIDAHLKLGFTGGGLKRSALDVADDEGEDLNAWGYMEGVIIRHIETWGGIDTTVTAQNANNLCNFYNVDEMQYDSIGVGAGVKGETNRLKRTKQVRKSLKIVPWAASGKVVRPEERVNPLDPESKKNKDFFLNLKAQAYWRLAVALFKTYRAVVHGDKYDESELVSIDSSMEGLHDFERELCQPERNQTAAGKMLVDKKPAGTKSPNRADCAVMMYTPAVLQHVIIG